MLNEKVGEVSYEGLIVSHNPPADVFSVTIKGGAGELKRGSVLALSTGTAGTGKMVLLGTDAATDETLTANCILAEDVDTTAGDTVALAYRTGHFNKQALITKTEFKAEHKEALRDVGILVSDALNY